MIEVPLSRGRVAIIDDADADLVLAFRWNLLPHKHTDTCYAKRKERIDGKWRTILLHRFLLGVTDRNVFVDHINRNGLDNRRANLRLTDRTGNSINRVFRKPNSTGYTGVTWFERYKRYRASIRVNGEIVYLGSFVTAEEAHAAYVAAGRAIHGDVFPL